MNNPVQGGSSSNAFAQDLPPIGGVRDLSLSITWVTVGGHSGAQLIVEVVNYSRFARRDVQVRITTDPPAARQGLEGLDTSRYLLPNPDYDASSGLWTVGELAPGRSSGLRLRVLSNMPAPQYVKVRAEIIGSWPADGAQQLDNNQAEVWLYITGTGSSVGAVAVADTELTVNWDNRTAGVMENPVFAVTAFAADFGSRNRVHFGQEKVVVKVALSEGLVFASTPSAPSGTSFSRTSSTTGVWRLGSGDRVPGTLRVPARLSTDAAQAPPLNRRCLTAQVVAGNPPLGDTAVSDPGVLGVDQIVRLDGPRTQCLGASETTVLSDREARLALGFCPTTDVRFVGICRGDETTALRVFHQDDLRDSRGGTWYRAEDVIFHVDPTPRNDDPVAIGGTTYHWAAGHVIPVLEGDDEFPGVRLVRSTAIRALAHSRKFRISDVTPRQRPGAIAIVDRYINNNMVELYEALNPDKSDKLVDEIGDSWINSDYAHLVLFTEPGVYRVNLGIEWTYKSTSSVRPGETMSASGTLTFVVGDVADLQVHDAGGHGLLPEGQQAYTLRAENNLEGTVELVEVALSGVPRGATPEVSSDGGRYVWGACDANGLCEGIWKIGDLESRDDRYFSGRSDGPTLTLLVEGDPDPITATITSTKTRTVTAGGQTYTVGVTDLDDSNSKDVSVSVGTGRGERDPEAPESLRVDRFGQIALLRWETVEKVSRWPVAYYQVERDNRVLDVEAGDPLYLDLQAGGNHVYRVRAVSDQGIAGAWSLPGGGTDVLAGTEGLGAPRGLSATPGVGDAGRMDLRWFAPSTDSGLRYVIEHATDGAGPWTTLVRGYSRTTYSHSASILLSGTTHYYRVAAMRGNDISAWSYVQATTEIVDGVAFYEPGWPENLRFTSIDRTSVTLVWDPPVDDGGSRVTGYEYRVFGPCASGADAVCDIVAPTRVSGTSRRISGLNREGTYQFEVRAVNAVGAGDWSQSITKDVGPQTAGGGRVILSPSRLSVREGGEATYRVKLSRAPTLPLFVTMHWDGTGDENLGGELPFQQFKILLPSGYDTSGLPEWCDGIRLDWDEAYAWNTGVPITVVAAEDDDSDNESLTIQHSIYTLSAECLGMDAEEWAPDPVYDGMYGLAIEVTERDND